MAVHAGREVDSGTGAISPPIYLSTTFERGADGEYPRIYSRNANPNREALERCLAELEGGAAAAAFSSGTAATMGVFQSLSPGDHVIVPSDVYHGTARLLRDILVPWGLETTSVDMTDVGEIHAGVQPNTKLVWVETPSNPLLKISDIAEVSKVAHEIGALCVCDNTWATPILQRPFDLGADLIVHATTKYLGGHADVVGGVVVAKVDDSFFQKVIGVQTHGGAVPSPFDCWLVLRGIGMLPHRMRVHSENAAKVAMFLSQHARVEAVHYPGLENHDGHETATRQMARFGGMVSFQVAGDRRQAMAVAAKVRLFTRATSLGGQESLIEHRASVEGPGTRTPQNLLRLSVGLENADDLIDDLAQALG